MLNEINKLILAASYKNPSLNRFYSDDLYEPNLKEVFKSCSIALDLALNKNILVYRGVSKSAYQYLGDIVSIDPSASSRERKPIASSRTMMYLYKNLPYFKDWPDRYRSIFFTNNYKSAKDFLEMSGTLGHIYLIFPYNTAKIACVWDDFNHPANLLPIFSKCLYKINHKMISYLRQNMLIEETEIKTIAPLSDVERMPKLLKYFNNENIKDLYNIILSEVKEAEIYDSEDMVEILYSIASKVDKSKTYNSAKLFKEILSSFNSMLESSSQYKLINSSMLTKAYTESLEYWTDDPCLMIEYEYFKEDLSHSNSAIRNIYNKIGE